MTAPVSEKVQPAKTRNTRHYKAELAAMTEQYTRAAQSLRDALEREGAAALRHERATYAAALDRSELGRLVRFWRLVALGMGGGLLLALAFVARVVLQ